MSRLFISHATADRSFVERELLGLLRALGFDAWLAEKDIQSAQQWERSILGALKSSKWLVLVMSPRSTASEWVKDEISWAINNIPDRIIPVLIEDCQPIDIHIRIPRLQYIDFKDNIQKAREDLIKLLVNSEYKPYVGDIGPPDPLRELRQRFWKPIIDDGLQIVLGRFTQFAQFEQSGFIGMGDAVAMTEIQSFLGILGLSGVSISYADRLEGDSLKTNLILLGGPDANVLTRETVSRLTTTLKFGNPDRHEIALFDSQNNRYFIPRLSASDKVENDFGIIYLCQSPFDPRKRILLAAGSFGYGTWACVRHVLSSDFLTNTLVARGANLECLIEVDILWETPQRIKSH